MRNINEYDEVDFEEQFANSEVAQAIQKDFDVLSWAKHFDPKKLYATERQQIGKRMFSMTSFYYINKLLEKNPLEIYDFGCGWNIFKKYLTSTNIIGVSPENPDDPNAYYGDHYDVFDADYATYHRDEFESAMAICSLQYATLTEIRNLAELFISVIKPGGRGYISFDIVPMVVREDPEILQELFNTTDPIAQVIDEYVIDQLSDLPCNYIVFDVDTCETQDAVDGTARILFERPME